MNERKNDVGAEPHQSRYARGICRSIPQQHEDGRGSRPGNARGIRAHCREEEQSDVGEKSKTEEKTGPWRATALKEG